MLAFRGLLPRRTFRSLSALQVARGLYVLYPSSLSGGASAGMSKSCQEASPSILKSSAGPFMLATYLAVVTWCGSSIRVSGQARSFRDYKLNSEVSMSGVSIAAFQSIRRHTGKCCWRVTALHNGICMPLRHVWGMALDRAVVT